MAETQAAKVDRFIAEDRVQKQFTLPDGGSVWRIRGDTGTYRLTIDDVGVEWQCTCPAALRGRKDCAHAWAVLKVMGLEPPEVELVPVDMPVQDLDRGSMTVVEPDAAVMADKANHDETNGEELDDDFDQVEVVGDDGPVPVVSAVQRRDLDISEAPVTWRVIESIQHTEAVPKDLRGKPASIAATMFLGNDWHLDPFESLRLIDAIEGRLSPSAELWTRLYRRAGHTIEVHQDDDKAVVITGTRSDTGEKLKVSYTLEDAARAGLITVGDNGEVKARSARGNPMPWEKYPNEMLWARAISKLVRRLAPDCADQTLVPI